MILQIIGYMVLFFVIVALGPLVLVFLGMFGPNILYVNYKREEDDQFFRMGFICDMKFNEWICMFLLLIIGIVLLPLTIVLSIIPGSCIMLYKCCKDDY